jgi:hypothetical protein
MTALRVHAHENWGRVVHHQTGGFSLVEITDEKGVPLQLPLFEMPTACIPLQLQTIGSRFLLQWDGIWPEESDTVEGLRERCRQAFRVLRSA